MYFSNKTHFIIFGIFLSITNLIEITFIEVKDRMKYSMKCLDIILGFISITNKKEIWNFDKVLIDSLKSSGKMCNISHGMYQ